MIMDTSELSTYIRSRLTVKVFLDVPELGVVRVYRDSILPILTKKMLEEGENNVRLGWGVEVNEARNEITIDAPGDEW